MTIHQILVHSNGPALWPEHKPLAEVLELKATTPELIWSSTYQGRPAPATGHTFRRQWWAGQNRFSPTDPAFVNDVYARYISFDTAMKATDTSDLTAWVIGDLQPDYRLAIVGGGSAKLEFPDLPNVIQQEALKWNRDGRLRGIIIEDRVSGTSAIQTLAATGDPEVAQRLIPFIPTTDKETRARQAAVWAANNCILLPEPTKGQMWLIDMEEDLFTFPQSIYRDRVDAFTQLILYLENILEHGYKARKESDTI